MNTKHFQSGVNKPILNVDKRGYIAEFADCGCGSPTYGWIVYRYDISLGKRIKSIECGGCEKIHDASDFELHYNQKVKN